MKEETLENILQQLIILNQQTAEMLRLTKNSMRKMGFAVD